MHETELSILEIDKQQLISQLEKLGAIKIQELTLKVWWYCDIGDDPENLPWFLRVRSYSDMIHEVTWKAKSKTDSHSRVHQEINFKVDNLDSIKAFFEATGMEQYAYQEKERITYKLDGWQFDIDTYPGIPTYVEIEGQSNDSIKEAVELLGLQANPTWNQGERILIDKHYGKNWYNMTKSK